MLQNVRKYPKNSFLISFDLISVSNIVNFKFVSPFIQQNGHANLRRNFELIYLISYLLSFLVCELKHKISRPFNASCYLKNHVNKSKSNRNRSKNLIFDKNSCEYSLKYCSSSVHNESVSLFIINRIFSRKETIILLLRSNVEINPGPVNETIEVISINCNGLTSDQRLLQAVGKIKKRIKDKRAVIFLQETHNANIMLLESIWNGSINVSVGSGVSKGVITLLTKDLSTVAFKADLEGRYLITTINLGHNYYIHTMNVYAPNNHVISKQFFKCSFEAWDSYLNAQSALLPLNHLSSSIIAGDFNCVINNHDFQNRSWTAKEKDLANTIQTKMEERMLHNTVLRSS